MVVFRLRLAARLVRLWVLFVLRGIHLRDRGAVQETDQARHHLARGNHYGIQPLGIFYHVLLSPHGPAI